MTEQTTILGRIENFVDGIESTAVDLVARLSPWLAPLPTAYLTATATVKHLAWPEPVGIIAGVVIESLGLASVATALELREYNQNKRKSDPGAPFNLAVALGGVYFASVTGLTVALDTLPQLAAFAPLVFPVMSLAGVTVLALRADHRRRLAGIAQSKAERKARRGTSTRRQRTGTKAEPVTASYTSVSGNTKDQARAILAERPGISGSELGRMVGRSERLGRKLKAELLPVAMSDNGGGTEVLEG